MTINFKFWDNSSDQKEGVHYVNGRSLKGPFPVGLESAMFGMGCFWGVEKIFWNQRGVWVTAVGYSGGNTVNPSYSEVCAGNTNHNEVVFLKFNPKVISYRELLKLFWEGHNPTQGNRQGNDIGTQYRSGIYTFSSQQSKEAELSMKSYSSKLLAKGFSLITTEIMEASEFFYAEDYHQQYLAKNPGGYCGLGGTGISF
tara:strand:+ start:1238 stop:1834 length:597 start_codon:yes stop_codon:yes gene_type:complete